MHLLANTIVLTSQGIPFLHAGVEMLRTKNGEENSYKSPDSINQLDWSRKTKYKYVYDYYQSLIHLRKNHPAFRMPTTEMIQEHLTFMNLEADGLIGFKISGHANGDQWKEIMVVFNGSKESETISIPGGSWTVVLEGIVIKEAGIRTVSDQLEVPASSTIILVQ